MKRIFLLILTVISTLSSCSTNNSQKKLNVSSEYSKDSLVLYQNGEKMITKSQSKDGTHEWQMRSGKSTHYACTHISHYSNHDSNNRQL